MKIQQPLHIFIGINHKTKQKIFSHETLTKMAMQWHKLSYPDGIKIILTLLIYIQHV